MAASNLPGLGLKGYAPKGEHDWDTWMNANLLMLSGLAQLTVRSRTQALATSEAEGAQIVPTDQPQGGRIAIYYGGGYHYFQPQEGWRAYVRDTDQQVVFNGGGWRQVAGLNQHHVIQISASTNIPESVLARGSVIVVDNAEAVTLTIVETPSGAEVPDGSSLPRQTTTILQKGVGQVIIAAGAGIMLHSPESVRKTRTQGCCVSVIPISASEYFLAGDLVP